jgi:urate oxidase
MVGGQRHLVVPYTLDTNDMRFATPQGFNSGEQFFNYLKDAFDVLYSEGDTCPKMLSIGLHARIAGRPARFAALARFLDYVQKHDKVWICRREDIARHWLQKHPLRYSPAHISSVDEATFVRIFGGVFESSPWVAQLAWAARPFSSLSQLHAAMVQAVQGASADQQLALIRAHPQLVSRLAIAEPMTVLSQNEQQGAGLDRCSPDEFSSFSALNQAYMARFGFPFIIAVKGLDRGAILHAFTQRVQHTPAEEKGECLRQIARIAWFRLHDLVEQGDL